MVLVRSVLGVGKYRLVQEGKSTGILSRSGVRRGARSVVRALLTPELREDRERRKGTVAM